MTGVGNRVTVIVFIGMGLLTVAVVPFLVIPLIVVCSWVLAAKLRTPHPSFSQAWLFAGVTAGFLTAAVGASIFLAPQVAVSVLLLLGFIVHAVTVILFGKAWSQVSDHPAAAWVATVSFGLVGLLGVVLMVTFGRGIALADAGQSSWVVDTLLLLSVIGIPASLLAGLIALVRMRTHRKSRFELVK